MFVCKQPIYLELYCFHFKFPCILFFGLNTCSCYIRCKLWNLINEIFVFNLWALFTTLSKLCSHIYRMFPDEIECLADCGTTHTILRHRHLFTEFTPCSTPVTTIIGTGNLIKGRGAAEFLLPNGTKFHVTDALFAPRGNRTLLSFKDIRTNGYHMETHTENGIEYMYITSNECGRKRIHEKLIRQSTGLYMTTIRIVASTYFLDVKDQDVLRLWHDRLGHPGRDVMISILKCSHGHPFSRQKRSNKTAQNHHRHWWRHTFSVTRGTPHEWFSSSLGQLPMNCLLHWLFQNLILRSVKPAHSLSRERSRLMKRM